ncbi:hypothetical protein AB4501_29420, partial [Vibrio sp. 10N.222.55.E8]
MPARGISGNDTLLLLGLRYLSKAFLLNPRQRIVLYRELQRRRAAGEQIEASELEKTFEYQAM